MPAKRTYLLLLLLALSAMCSAASMDHFAILPPNQAKAMLQQCSRDAPEKVDGSWVISPSVAMQLEQDLARLSGLKSHRCCMASGTVGSPDTYARQYVGVTVSGKRYVYINAFPLGVLADGRPSQEAWPRRPVMFCDGGSAFWGALYDPETRQFSELAFNGLA